MAPGRRGMPPTWPFAAAGPHAIVVGAVQNPNLVPLQGKNIAEIAKLWNKDPIDTVFDLLVEDEAFTGVAMVGMSEPDVVLALQQPWVSVCNDSQGTAPDGLLGKEHPHPRAYGTPGAEDALGRPRRAEGGNVGGRGAPEKWG